MAITNKNSSTATVNNTYYTNYLNKNVTIHFKNIDKYTVKGKLISFDNYNNITVETNTEDKDKCVVIRGCNIDSIETSK
ncbi:hypothetical protein HANVADRAFT_52407 [Hanseniaspora valbyensis NRRL Y-1626]|uniref:Sm domain-containing protein n=1 Tax=Hanseniaspora valbyensis NRRL Y-1626 TaxID=766949 RepID=A0A1B7TFA5_9ASCO|nr:hypothetical protein HANVADRAFT_52407 [Hanseniaspora valbyensis NRRL Y-1626]